MLLQVAPMSVSAATPTKIYVNSKSTSTSPTGSVKAPYKTLAAAEPAVIEALKTSDVELLLFGGDYYDTNVNFTAAEIGGNSHSLTIAPKSSSDNVVISGGKEVTGFEIYDSEKNIYRAPYGSTIRQLYVNGTPATRARSTSTQLPFTIEGTPGAATAVTTTNTAVANWNLSNAELVFRQSFVSGRKMITGVSVSGGKATFELYNGIKNLDNNFPLVHVYNYSWVLCMENAYELIDEPGEWYSDGAAIYYKPRAGEVMGTTPVVAPARSQPLSFTGAKGSVISNITIKDITFAHGTWTYPSTAGEIVDMQSNSIAAMGDEEIPGLINTRYVNNVKIEGCTFTNSGGSGLDILKGSKNVTVTGCEISNIASAGVLISSVKTDDRLGTVEADVVENITIEQSKIHDCARDYRSATGVAIGFARNVNIVHNEIYNLPYSGIHCGWGWRSSTDSMIKGIKINYNYIYDCMKEMQDGGLVYVMGPTNREAGLAGYRNEIAYNFLEDMGAQGGYIYHDNGSTYWSAHHNVIYCNETEETSWANTAPDTESLSIVDNFTNFSAQTTTGRVYDYMLKEMINQTITYEMVDGQPRFNGSLLRTADAVKKNAGVKTPTLYSFDDMRDTMVTDKVEFVGDDAIIGDGGSIEFGADLVNKALNYNVYAEGDSSAYYEITVDDTYKARVYSNKIEYYVNGSLEASVASGGWATGNTYDALISLPETSFTFATPLVAAISKNATITKGRVVITVHGMDMAIGDLSKHYTFYQELLKSYETTESTQNIVSNGYFEKDASSWSATSASAVYSTDYGYAGTLGSLKVTESAAEGYAYTTATLEGGKWYRVSAKVRMQDSYSAGTAYAELYASTKSSTVQTWGAKNTLASGWNHIKDYIKVDSNTTVTLGVKVTGSSSSSTKYTYYIDNFEVVEETPSVTEGGFEMGKGYWTGNYSTPSITANGYTGSGLTMNNTRTSGSDLATRPVHFVKGKTYKARARVKIASTTDSSTATSITFAADNNKPDVNLDAQYGFYTIPEASVGVWHELEFYITWAYETTNDIGYLKVLPGVKSVIIIDDVELSEVKPYKTATTNANFVDGMTDWKYSGIDALTCTTGEGVKVEPASKSAKLYQDINALVDVPYYAECFVKLDSEVASGYAEAKVNVELLDSTASATSDDFTVASGVATSNSVVLNAEQWSKVGGIITFSSSDATKLTVKARISASVLTDTNAAVDYHIMGLRLVPVEAFETTLSDAGIYADGTVAYTATGDAGNRIRYRYYTYSSGWVLTGSGYVSAGADLPSIGTGDVMAVLTTTATDGADEITLIVEKASVKVLNATLSGNKITINAVANNPMDKDFIIAVYDGKLMKQAMFATSDVINETITITDTFEREAIVKAFIWDMDLLRPLCSDKSVKVN